MKFYDFKPFFSFNPLPEEVECQVKSADAAFLLTRAKADLARRSLAERNVVVGFVIKTGSNSSFVSVKSCQKINHCKSSDRLVVNLNFAYNC